MSQIPVRWIPVRGLMDIPLPCFCFDHAAQCIVLDDRMFLTRIHRPSSDLTMIASRARASLHRQAFITTATSRRPVGRTCIRRPFSSGPEPPPTPPPSFFRKHLRSGTPELIFGFGLLTLLAADRLLQNRQEAQHKLDRETVLQRLRYDVASDTAQSRADGHSLSVEEESSKPCLFKCKIMTVPRLFDGTKSLMGVQVGDIVDVLEERVGPGGTYNLCRFVAQPGMEGSSSNKRKDSDVISVGWYPMSCLEKIKS